MKKITISIISLMIAVAFAVPVYSQDDDPRVRGYGFHMLEDPVNPRNVAMGSVGTALGGFGFRYYNPVAPFFCDFPHISAEFGQLPGGLNKYGFESALMFPEWFSAVSFYSSSIDFETRDERGFGSAASFTSTVGSVSAGYIRDELSAGIALTMAEDRIWVESRYTAFALSAGLGYKMLDGKLNLGAAGFHGIGRSRGRGEETSKWRDGEIPRFARGGAAWMDTLKSFPYTAAADVVYRDEDGSFTVPVGVEVMVLPSLALRMGKRFGWETEVMSFGVGFTIDRMSFDAAFTPSVLVDDYEMKWNMSFTYNLGSKFGEKEKVKEKEFPPVKAVNEVDVDVVDVDVDSVVVEDVAEDVAEDVVDESVVDESVVDDENVVDDKDIVSEDADVDVVEDKDAVAEDNVSSDDVAEETSADAPEAVPADDDEDVLDTGE